MRKAIMSFVMSVVLLQIAFPVFGEGPAAETGGYVYFGSYEQHIGTSEGAEPIEWLVLDNRGDRIMLISRYGLAARPYNDSGEDCTWESCSLRGWLNNEFLDTAFTDEEKTLIIPTQVTTRPNPQYATDPGSTVTDMIFLLSTDESELFLPNEKSRMCAPTPYAFTHGVYRNKDYAVPEGACCWWWYRTPGSDAGHAAYSYFDGRTVFFGDRVFTAVNAVRPVLWLYTGGSSGRG